MLLQENIASAVYLEVVQSLSTVTVIRGVHVAQLAGRLHCDGNILIKTKRIITTY